MFDVFSLRSEELVPTGRLELPLILFRLHGMHPYSSAMLVAVAPVTAFRRRVPVRPHGYPD